MRYSIEHRDFRHVKDYGFLSFARNIGTHGTKVAKNMSNKYSQKLVDTAKKSATDAIKTASKREIQKTAEATGDLVGNKITSASIKSHNKEIESNEVNNTKYRKRDIFLQKKGKKLLMD